MSYLTVISLFMGLKVIKFGKEDPSIIFALNKNRPHPPTDSDQGKNEPDRGFEGGSVIKK
jgi:hypothetical protein